MMDVSGRTGTNASAVHQWPLQRLVEASPIIAQESQGRKLPVLQAFKHASQS